DKFLSDCPLEHSLDAGNLVVGMAPTPSFVKHRFLKRFQLLWAKLAARGSPILRLDDPQGVYDAPKLTRRCPCSWLVICLGKLDVGWDNVIDGILCFLKRHAAAVV